MSENPPPNAEERGRRLVRVLAALAPERGDAQVAAYRNASLMPAYFAQATTWILENGNDAPWYGMIGRYAALASRFHFLGSREWDVLAWTLRRIAVEQAAPHAGAATAAVERVMELLRRAERDDVVSSAEWAAAAAAARAEAAWAETADQAAWESAWAAAWAARADSESESTAPTRAAEAAVRATRAAARATARTTEAAARVAEQSAETAADTITAAILDAIEAAIVAREHAHG